MKTQKRKRRGKAERFFRVLIWIAGTAVACYAMIMLFFAGMYFKFPAGFTPHPAYMAAIEEVASAQTSEYDLAVIHLPEVLKELSEVRTVGTELRGFLLTPTNVVTKEIVQSESMLVLYVAPPDKGTEEFSVVLNGRTIKLYRQPVNFGEKLLSSKPIDRDSWCNEWEFVTFFTLWTSDRLKEPEAFKVPAGSTFIHTHTTLPALLDDATIVSWPSPEEGEVRLQSALPIQPEQ